MNNKQQLTHDFIKFVMENYGIRLTMTESDGEKFEELFPDGDKELNLLEMENELRPYAIGDKIAQCLIHRVEDSKFIVVNELPETDRGADGGINRDDTNFKV